MSQGPVEGAPGLAFSADADGWRDATSRVTGAWSDAMAHTDLRWFRLSGSVPANADLAKRWGWDVKQVRAFMAWDRSHG